MNAVVEAPERAAESATAFRSVEIARRQDVDSWDLADAIFDDVAGLLDDDASSSAHGVHTGLYRAEEVIHRAHAKAGTEVGRNYLHQLYVTRRVWPPNERRPDLAGFGVHYELRGKAFKNRRALIEKHAARSKTGRWSRADLLRWKSERKPPRMKSFRELFEDRVRKAAYLAGKPWHALEDDDRQALAKVCRAIANEIEAGTFGS